MTDAAAAPATGLSGSAANTVAVLRATEVGGLARLEPLARAIFGQGDRPDGWFERKLRRECVDPALSVVATATPDAPTDPGGWLGYGLMGAPPSCHPKVRTAGIGLVPGARGRGHGRALVDALIAGARARGASGVRTIASATAADFYAHMGYTRVGEHVTTLAFGSAAATQPSPETPGCDAGTGSEPAAKGGNTLVHASWLPEAWEGTPAPSRASLRWQSATGTLQLDITREGVAHVCHRLRADRSCTAASVAAALEHWRALHAERTPLLILGLGAGEPLPTALIANGWHAVQRSTVYELAL